MASGYPALMIKPPESPVQQLGGIMQLQQMAGAQQLQQQQIQSAQTQNQSAQLDLQMKQQQVKNMQVTQSALSDPHLSDDFQKWQKSKGSGSSGSDDLASSGTSGSGSPLGLHPIAEFLAETKGLPMAGPGGALEISQNITKNAQAVAELLKTNTETAKDQIAIKQEQIENLTHLAAPVLAETDPVKQQSALDMFKLQVKMSPKDLPNEIVSQLPNINTVSDLAKLTNFSGVHKEIYDLGQKLADEQTAQATATQKIRETAGVTDKYGVLTPQAQAVADTVKTLPALTGAQQLAAQKELKTAPDMENLQKMQDRWTAISASNQRSQEAQAAARALKDVGVQQAMAGELVKEDNTRDTTLASSQNIRAQLDMSKGGNQQATQDVMTAFAAHELRQGGINRITQPEINTLGKDTGSYVRQLQSWYAKGSKGQMPEATASNISDILNLEDKQTVGLHDQQVGNIVNRFSQISGGGVKAPAAATGTIRARDPNGVLHEAKPGTPLPAGWKLEQ